jgi:hypothetical protein
MTENKLARAISYLFHPLLIPSYVLMLLLNFDSLLSHPAPLSYKLTMLGMVALTTLFFPLFLTWLLSRLQIIHSVMMNHREERIYPILSVAVFYYLTWFLIRDVHISNLFSYYLLGATLLAVLSLMANFFFKISLHTVAAGSVAGLFLGLSLNFGVNLYVEIFSAILLAGIIGYARLKLMTHRPPEIYTGFMMGMVVMSLLMLLL